MSNNIIDTPTGKDGPRLDRATFTTSRLLDFATEKELITQTGHGKHDWPRVAVKELIDNAIDECEDARVPPVVTLVVNGDGITVTDNGRGLPAETIKGVTVRRPKPVRM